MEKYGDSTTATTAAASDSTGVCEKLFSAITASPTFRTIRRISSPARDRCLQTNPKPRQSNKSPDQVSRVPIKFEKTEALQPAALKNGMLQTSQSNVHAQKITNETNAIQGHEPPQKATAKIEPELAQSAQKKVIAIEQISCGREAKKDINDTFSEYINRAKIKLRTLSSKKLQEPVDVNGKDHHFSDYIHRAKNKFKSSTSSVDGTGKSLSFKRNHDI